MFADIRVKETPAPAEPAVSEPTEQAEAVEDGTNAESATTNGAAPAVEAPAHADDDFEVDFGDLAEFKNVFQRFQERQEDEVPEKQEKEQVIWDEDNDNIPDEEEEAAAARKSKKQRKRENKLSVAELKAMARKPELVEWTDADSSDPRLLLSIKSHRNVVPVPAHWSLKREVRPYFLLNRPNVFAKYTTVPVLETRYRKACLQVAQIHRRHRYRRNARRRTREASRADAKAEAARKSSAKDGTTRHRLWQAV